MITEIQKKHLRGLGHQRKPVVLVGNAGMSDAVLREIDSALDSHELIKVKVRSGDRDSRDAAIATMCERSGATLIQRIGNTALIYRSNPDQPRIRLP